MSRMHAVGAANAEARFARLFLATGNNEARTRFVGQCARDSQLSGVATLHDQVAIGQCAQHQIGRGGYAVVEADRTGCFGSCLAIFQLVAGRIGGTRRTRPVER